MASTCIGKKKFTIKDVAKDNITLRVEVSGVKVYRIRLKIASLLFKLGAWICFAKCEVGINE